MVHPVGGREDETDAGETLAARAEVVPGAVALEDLEAAGAPDPARAIAVDQAVDVLEEAAGLEEHPGAGVAQGFRKTVVLNFGRLANATS